MSGLLQPKAAMQQPEQAPADTKQKGQQMYKQLVEMVLSYVYSEQGTQMIKQGLQLEGAEFTQNAGNVMAKLMMRLMISMATAGKKLPPQMLFQAGMEFASAITEMGEAMGVTDAAPGTAKQVFFAGLTITGRELPEEVLTPEEKQTFVQLINQVKQMDDQKAAQPEQPGGMQQ